MIHRASRGTKEGATGSSHNQRRRRIGGRTNTK